MADAAQGLSTVIAQQQKVPGYRLLEGPSAVGLGYARTGSAM